MSNAPYRTAELPKGVELTKLEKLFLSGKKWDKFKFHTIVIGKPLVQLIGALLLGAALIGAVVGLACLLFWGIDHLEHYVITHNYLTKKQFIFGGLLSLLGIIIIGAIVSSIRKEIKENNERWSDSIKLKLNPTPTYKNEDDDSE